MNECTPSLSGNRFIFKIGHQKRKTTNVLSSRVSLRRRNTQRPTACVSPICESSVGLSASEIQHNRAKLHIFDYACLFEARKTAMLRYAWFFEAGQTAMFRYACHFGKSSKCAKDRKLSTPSIRGDFIPRRRYPPSSRTMHSSTLSFTCSHLFQCVESVTMTLSTRFLNNATYIGNT